MHYYCSVEMHNRSLCFVPSGIWMVISSPAFPKSYLLLNTCSLCKKHLIESFIHPHVPPHTQFTYSYICYHTCLQPLMLVVKALFFSSTNENIYYSEEVNAVIYSHADAQTLAIFFFAVEHYILGEALRFR